jgi:hypothetical protein
LSYTVWFASSVACLRSFASTLGSPTRLSSGVLSNGPGRTVVLSIPPIANRRWPARHLALCALILALIPARALLAQSQPTTHNLTLANATESIDARGRIVLVANVQGDLPGVLTLALVVSPDGTVTGGEWALNVSYIQFGPPSSDGDGDASESLVQLGVIKGSVSGGSTGLASNGFATALTAIQLNVTGATVQFAGTTNGSGSVTGSSMDRQDTSSGSLTISF